MTEIRQIRVRGGSMSITIPPHITVFKEGDWLSFKPIDDNKLLLTKIVIPEDEL